jgi:hypothetical protein
LLNSCEATVQSTSGGGGEGALVTARGDVPVPMDILETLRCTLGEFTLAIKDWVGDENVGGVPSLGFLGSDGGGGGLTVASSFSSCGTDHHWGS